MKSDVTFTLNTGHNGQELQVHWFFGGWRGGGRLLPAETKLVKTSLDNWLRIYIYIYLNIFIRNDRYMYDTIFFHAFSFQELFFFLFK